MADLEHSVSSMEPLPFDVYDDPFVYTEKEKEAVQALRAKLPANHVVDDHTLIRFLRARKLDVNVALDLYTGYLKYREEKKVDQILDNIPPFYEVLRKVSPFAYHGFDKFGRPVFFQRIGHAHVDAFCLFSEADIALGHLIFLERSFQRFKESSAKTGRPVSNVTIVLDCEGLTISHRKVAPFLKVTSEIDQKYFPELLGAMYLINCPWIFPALWAIGKPWLDKRTQRKIHIFGTHYQEHLRKIMNADQLPSIFGGQCTCPQNGAGGCLPEYSKEEVTKSMAALEKLNGKKLEEAAIPEETQVVSARSSFQIVMNSNKANARFSWAWRTESYDLGFSIEWLPNGQHAKDEKGNPKPIWIQAPTRFNSHITPVSGAYSSPGVGRLLFVWDNLYSRWTSKKLFYNLVGDDSAEDPEHCDEIVAAEDEKPPQPTLGDSIVSEEEKRRRRDSIMPVDAPHFVPQVVLKEVSSEAVKEKVISRPDLLSPRGSIQSQPIDINAPSLTLSVFGDVLDSKPLN